MGQAEIENRSIEEIRLLVFNIMGVKFGADMEQIREITELGQVDKEQVTEFHEIFPFSETPVKYKTPTVLFLKGEEASCGIVIDQPQGVVNVSIDSIKPLPPLLEGCMKSAAIWGVDLTSEDIILLVDFSYFSGSNRSRTASRQA